MPKKKVVALIFGGRSAEHEISLLSALAIHSNLDRKKYAVRSIYISRDGRWRIVRAPSRNAEELRGGGGSGFLPWQRTESRSGLMADIYFPVLHGPFGEDGTIQGLLEMAGVPFVGAGVLSSAAGMDKATAKSLFAAAGLPVGPHMVILENQWRAGRSIVLRLIRENLELPLFVKPSNLGSSIGITKVKAWARTAAAVDEAFRYDRKILVEKAVSGRELECSVLGNDTPEASLPGEIIPSREFYDYRDKYLEGKTGFVIPAELPKKTVREIRNLAIAAFRAVGGAGMARVDFFLESGTGKLIVNEINSIPGFTEISMYPKLWAVSGLSFPRLLDRLIELGFERHRTAKRRVERGRM
jgi:D-alanine-D-alanine ligase